MNKKSTTYDSKSTQKVNAYLTWKHIAETMIYFLSFSCYTGMCLKYIIVLLSFSLMNSFLLYSSNIFSEILKIPCNHIERDQHISYFWKVL